ncbi:MAG: peptidoglycan DD-metalloendopeptidase family protein [Campylobacterales bacterium]|nr:peptidoglycan DD-metalloendopeptidase family protein [Campylobacterales bacterium]
MKVIVFLFLTLTTLFSAFVQEDIWWKGENLLTFFDKHGINKDIYFNLSKTDKELCSEINAGVDFQTMYDNKGKLSQALIPISEEMQIHIYKDFNNSFSLDIIPISFQEFEETISIPITSSPYKDIVDATNNKNLANEFMLAFKKSVNFRKLQNGDMISIKYKQKIRLGKYFGTPVIYGAYVTVNKRQHFIFQNDEDNRYYDEDAKSLTSVYFKVPLSYNRISSKFTYKRFHPVLKQYRAHLGVDFAAPIGRNVFATADGRIIHKGRKGGYGKTIIIRHSNGYKSLYAHLNGYNNKLKVGSYVKQGDYIGQVGSTGRSTGPHLHFGIYKNNRAVDPLKVIQSAKATLAGKQKQQYLKTVESIKKELLASVESKKIPRKLEEFKPSYSIQ